MAAGDGKRTVVWIMPPLPAAWFVRLVPLVLLPEEGYARPDVRQLLRELERRMQVRFAAMALPEDMAPGFAGSPSLRKHIINFSAAWTSLNTAPASCACSSRQQSGEPLIKSPPFPQTHTQGVLNAVVPLTASL